MGSVVSVGSLGILMSDRKPRTSARGSLLIQGLDLRSRVVGFGFLGFGFKVTRVERSGFGVSFVQGFRASGLAYSARVVMSSWAQETLNPKT